MFALMRAAEGLLIAHVCLALFFLLGSSIFPWCDRRRPAELLPSELMMRVVATCGLGAAVFGFVAFALAAVGALNPAAFFAAAVAVSVFAAMWFGASPLSISFWRARLDALGSCWDASSLLVYYLMIGLSLPAIVGNFGGSDPVAYHLVYAYEWQHTGRLVIDPFLRLPFYASNFVLLFSVLMSVGAAIFVNFLSWAMALLAALGVCSSVRTVLNGRVESRYAAIAAVALTAAVILSAAQLRWMDTAYIDTPIGAFALMSLVAVLLSLQDAEKGNWLAAAAAIGGFLIGMKGSFIALVPVYLIVLLVAARYTRLTRRTVLIVVALLMLCGSPWYVRNIIVAGDPTPPVLNIARYGTDGLMSKDEWAMNQRDLSTPKTPAAILTLPVRAFFHAQDRDFREYGVTALMLFLYVPVLIALAAFAFHKRLGAVALVSMIFLALLAAYWELTSSLLRYAALVYPVLAVAVAAAIAPLIPQRKLAGPLVALGALALMVPSPGASDFLHQNVMQLRYLPASYPDDRSYMMRLSPDYAEVQFTTDLMKRYAIEGKVYTLGPRVDYNFLENGIASIGDWMGPGGYFRLYRAVDARQAADYLKQLNVTAVLVDPKKAVPALAVPLEQQLGEGGFCKIVIPDSADDLFLQSARLCAKSQTTLSMKARAAAEKSE